MEIFGASADCAEEHQKVFIAFFLILWMVIRTVKYYFVVDPNINRILWYCYYIPMLFVPLFSVFVSASIGKPENSRMSKLLIPATILTFIFTLFVLTNDFHQLVFAFPELYFCP